MWQVNDGKKLQSRKASRANPLHADDIAFRLRLLPMLFILRSLLFPGTAQHRAHTSIYIDFWRWQNVSTKITLPKCLVVYISRRCVHTIFAAYKSSVRSLSSTQIYSKHALRDFFNAEFFSLHVFPFLRQFGFAVALLLMLFLSLHTYTHKYFYSIVCLSVSGHTGAKRFHKLNPNTLKLTVNMKSNCYIWWNNDQTESRTRCALTIYIFFLLHMRRETWRSWTHDLSK